MVDKWRLNNLAKWCLKFKNHKGSFVECGVAKGGCLSIMAHYATRQHNIWGFDSFEDMPELSVEDEESGKEWVGYRCAGPEGEQAVYKTFQLLGVKPANVHVVRGYFEDTLEKHLSEIGDILVLRLDNDWYHSTRFCLRTLYRSVAAGGVVIIDDYGTFQGCRKAVDEFRTENKIVSPLIKTKGQIHEYYWVKM